MTDSRIQGTLVHLELPPNTVCSGLGGTRRFLRLIQVRGFSRFVSWFSRPTANADRWVLMKQLKNKFLRIENIKWNRIQMKNQ